MIALRSHSFKRLIIGLSPGSAVQSTELAVNVAGLLQLELMGLYLDDPGLRNLAANPFAREFRLHGGGWHPVRADRIEEELEIAAHSTERAFMQVAARLAARHQFEVMRGPIHEALSTLSQSSDIIMITEPVSAADRVTLQFEALTEAAFRSTAAVVLVPRQSERGSGPIVAIATTPDDPSIAVAAAIASNAKETLIILQAYDRDDPEHVQELAKQTDVTIRPLRIDPAILGDASVCVQKLMPVAERLIVMSRSVAATGFAPALMAARRIPVLVLESEISAESRQDRD